MIGFSRRPPLRDPQAGVPFRPWMLVHAGSLTALSPHRIGPVESNDARRGAGLLPWTLVMAGLMVAFFLGTSWSSAPRPLITDACLATAPAPAAAPSAKDAEGAVPR